MQAPPPPPYKVQPRRFSFRNYKWLNSPKWQWANLIVVIINILLATYFSFNRESPKNESPTATSLQAHTNNPTTAEQHYQQARQYIQRNNWAAALPYLEQAAQAGHAKAQNNLGVAYLEGNGTRKNPTLGCEWVGKSAQAPNQTDLRILDNWGRCLIELPQPNYSLAIKAFLPAAQAGLSGAQFSLGDLYLNGQGVAADPSTGLYWIGLAAAQGEKNALTKMGYCLSTRECSQQYYNPAIGYVTLVLAAQRQPNAHLPTTIQLWFHRQLTYGRLYFNEQQRIQTQTYLAQWQNLNNQALVEQIWQASGTAVKQP